MTSETAQQIHDLKNHLTIILGFSELVLENTRDDDPRKADLHEISSAAARALTLARQMYPPESGAP
jgi:signal transduction histidine kinase